MRSARPRSFLLSADPESSTPPPASTDGVNVGTFRLPVEKPQQATRFLLDHGQGVMDLIAHFWDLLPQTPPLQRSDLHLVLAYEPHPANEQGNVNESTYIDKTNSCVLDASILGAMLLVPKARRADVLAKTPSAAAAFVEYARAVAVETLKDGMPTNAPDVSAWPEGEQEILTFITGNAEGVDWMLPPLLAAAKRKAPHRYVVNDVMELPATVKTALHPHVRLAKAGDHAVLNRWRRQYKDERGILFDADMDAWVASQRVYLLEKEGHVVSCGKFDLELPRRMEIGGVYTFPEFRNRGYGRILMQDLAARVRSLGKVPVLQVDRSNLPASRIYTGLGWRPVGQLGRAWLVK
jgi:GNAT superfamily N-acetyltransferase